ncbi:hypothetical protein ScPMuIL_010763 [Solemya velum]
MLRNDTCAGKDHADCRALSHLPGVSRDSQPRRESEMFIGDDSVHQKAALRGANVVHSEFERGSTTSGRLSRLPSLCSTLAGVRHIVGHHQGKLLQYIPLVIPPLSDGDDRFSCHGAYDHMARRDRGCWTL